ncbi:MAG: phosphoribosylanthranilate isomerase [Desulfobacter sp.]|nr:phosphoribosylanthranilate isomerase [Desulfobacter sp.]
MKPKNPHPFFLNKTRPLVKICGLTQPKNALACVHAGADMIGLVFFKKSPRNIEFDKAKQITSALPVSVLVCGVFVDEDFDTIMQTVEGTGIQGVQLHGSEPPLLAEQLSHQGLVVIKAFFAARKPDFSLVKTYEYADLCLVEYGKGVLPGGNAETWDYGLTQNLTPQVPLMLAGGLSPDNIGQALAQAPPMAVDASSGVELSPGIKDIPKVLAFVEAAKACPMQRGW